MMPRIVFTLQKILLYVSYYTCLLKSMFVKKSENHRIEWVVGTQEVASMLGNITTHLKFSKSVNLHQNFFYSNTFDYVCPHPKNSVLRKIIRTVYGPILLGKLGSVGEKFVYLGEKGFLIHSLDQRSFELGFLKNRKKLIISILTGTDIRSPQKMKTQELISREENFGTYQFGHFSEEEFDELDNTQRARAKVIDEFSDVIFQSEYDQASYLSRPHNANWFFLNPEIFNSDLSKFKHVEKPTILHAPSNPYIKGTQIVRSVIRKLELDGYEFQYIELKKQPNDFVLRQLSQAHIVINELFGFVPGYFAMEAMAKSCVVLTRADENFEKDLPPNSNDAWVVTPPYLLYDKLKNLLDNRDLWANQASRGYNWVRTYAHAPTSTKRMTEIVEKVIGQQDSAGSQNRKRRDGQ